MSKRKDTVLAQLGIQLERPGNLPMPGLSPSDEELAGLFDDTLGEQRKKELLTHIARDENTYLRWKRCVEINTYMQELESENHVQQYVAVTPPKKNTAENIESSSLLDKISDFIFGKNSMILGGGLATTAAVVLVTTLAINNSAENTVMGIDSLYESYGISLSQSWNNNTHTKHPAVFSSTRSFFSAEKTKERKLIESGFKSGAEMLDNKMFVDLGINITSLDELPADNSLSEMALFELGKINAITTLQCEQKLVDSQFENQLKHNELIMQDILKNLKQVNTREIQNIRVAFNENPTNIATRVCATNYAIVQLISK